MDLKNPVLICVATVVEVVGDYIKIVFDGWKGSKYTYRYDSRDIFPVGWCYFSGHPLQPPGDVMPTVSEWRRIYRQFINYSF